MPIEIKELVIRAVVQGGGEQKGGPDDTGQAREEIVQECVEQVLELLRRREER